VRNYEGGMSMFQAHLQRGGIGISEILRLLQAYRQHGEWERVKQLALSENILGKTSDHMVKSVLYTFKRLFFSDTGLPPVDLVSQFMDVDLPQLARMQTLLPYFLLSDPLVKQCYCDLVLNRLSSNKSTLVSSEVVEYLLTLSIEHPELLKWSEYLRKRWARGFISLLRKFGLMEPSPQKGLRSLWLLNEPFAFFWFWFWQKDGSFWSVWKKEIWELLQLDDKHKEKLLIDGESCGWWTYRRSGEIVHFQPKFSSLLDWIENGLA